MTNQTINDTSVNSQITDTVSQVNTTMLGTAASEAMGLIDMVTAETLGMSMHNAITAQQNSQMSTTASVTASCAKMLQAQIPTPVTPSPPVPDVPPPFLPLDPPEHITAAELIKQATQLASMAKTMLEAEESTVKEDEQSFKTLSNEIKNISTKKKTKKKQVKKKSKASKKV